MSCDTQVGRPPLNAARLLVLPLVFTGAAAVTEAASERFVLEFQVGFGAWQREPLASCRGARFEEALPARPFRFEKGLRSFAGWWYFATTETHVGFESWLERDHLMLMDFAPDVLAVSSQPFWLRWHDEGGRSRRHVPDFFARTAWGPGWLSMSARMTASLPGTPRRSR